MLLFVSYESKGLRVALYFGLFRAEPAYFQDTRSSKITGNLSLYTSQVYEQTRFIWHA